MLFLKSDDRFLELIEIRECSALSSEVGAVNDDVAGAWHCADQSTTPEGVGG